MKIEKSIFFYDIMMDRKCNYMKFMFEKPLKEAILLKRNSQFTMDIEIDGRVEKAHCPTTNRIGNIEVKNIACLVYF